MMILGGLAVGNPVLVRHVSLAVLLAPVAFTSHITSSVFIKTARMDVAEVCVRG